MKATTATEHQEQSRVVAWFNAFAPTKRIEPRLLVAVPNANMLMRFARNPAAMMSYMKAEGFRKGMLDMVLFWPCNGWPGMVLELKRVGAKATPAQVEMMDLLRQAGYNGVLAEGGDAAITAIKAYIG